MHAHQHLCGGISGESFPRKGHVVISLLEQRLWMTQILVVVKYNHVDAGEIMFSVSCLSCFKASFPSSLSTEAKLF